MFQNTQTSAVRSTILNIEDVGNIVFRLTRLGDLPQLWTTMLIYTRDASHNLFVCVCQYITIFVYFTRMRANYTWWYSLRVDEWMRKENTIQPVHYNFWKIQTNSYLKLSAESTIIRSGFLGTNTGRFRSSKNVLTIFSASLAIVPQSARKSSYWCTASCGPAGVPV